MLLSRAHVPQRSKRSCHVPCKAPSKLGKGSIISGHQIPPFWCILHCTGRKLRGCRSPRRGSSFGRLCGMSRPCEIIPTVWQDRNSSTRGQNEPRTNDARNLPPCAGSSQSREAPGEPGHCWSIPGSPGRAACRQAPLISREKSVFMDFQTISKRR